ncbi:RidA family protein [Caballeronia sp. NCTM5]|uniref:RidA family protein n=1 Tax=Caballeronia sp. NCTM5 TaxID=2921755 RepID=UPI002028F910|nr:RidA family protein [Caballeronia sp. NCTM5]
MSVEMKLRELGLELPIPPRPLGTYNPVSQAGSLLFLSGQIPIVNGELAFAGRVGAELTVEMAQQAAILATLNVLAHIRAHLDGFDRLEEIVRVEGHISSTDGFHGQVEIMNFSSNLLVAVLGERAGHARTVFSVNQLPENAALMLVVIARIRA